MSAKAITCVQTYLKDFGIRMDAAKRHMRESVTMLNEIQLELVEQVLLGQLQHQEYENRDRPFACPLCQSQGTDTRYKNKKDLAKHLEICAFKSVDNCCC
jgi:hypothetical protein